MSRIRSCVVEAFVLARDRAAADQGESCRHDKATLSGSSRGSKSCWVPAAAAQTARIALTEAR
ncbi:hypothetical protein JVX96_24975 [Variovorax sp. PDNC026]|uniref:hypothetical protein n=1 Tax=Variovorax sp. PDNC026 TaxID=2811425 RepID=UPI001963F54E|nr:hypothetical protein [Variovorax sp. PDNC026]QRY31292.1 hypothetical protein JVX96_24975 [Variovorax sp. PDNC026]